MKILTEATGSMPTGKGGQMVIEDQPQNLSRRGFLKKVAITSIISGGVEPLVSRELHASEDRGASNLLDTANKDFRNIVNRYPNNWSQQKAEFFRIKSGVTEALKKIDGKQRHVFFEDYGYVFDIWFQSSLNSGNTFENIFKRRQIQANDLEIFMPCKQINNLTETNSLGVLEIFSKLIPANFKIEVPVFTVDSNSFHKYYGGRYYENDPSKSKIVLHMNELGELAETIGADETKAKKLVLANELAHTVLGKAIAPYEITSDTPFPSSFGKLYIFSTPIQTKKQLDELLSDVASMNVVPEDIFRILTAANLNLRNNESYYLTTELAKEITRVYLKFKNFDTLNAQQMEKLTSNPLHYFRDQAIKFKEDPDSVVRGFITYAQEQYKIAGEKAIDVIQRWTGKNYPKPASAVLAGN